MLCLNCGRQVEFVGNVCPWCGAQKMRPQAAHICFYMWGFIGVGIGGGIGCLVAGDEGGFIGGAIGGVILGVVGYVKGLNAFDRVVKCPNCGSDMAVKKSHTRPFHHCPNCGSLGYRTSFNVARNPDKYCGNCGKSFGGGEGDNAKAAPCPFAVPI